MTPQRAVLLVGSGKPAGKSTSEALGRYLFDRLAESGVSGTVVNVNRTRRPAEDVRIAALANEADLLVIATPLYVDSLPYLLIRALENLAAARAASARRPCRLAVLINCGFPEARQCRTALAILEAFARKAGIEWAGGLALGEGGAIDGRRVEDLGGMGRNIRSALELTAGALARGEDVPAAAVALFAKPMMPRAVYVLMGNFGWRQQAARNGVRRRLGDRPYEPQ